MTKLQDEIMTVLTNEWQSPGMIEQARRAKGYKAMTVNGIRKSCESLAAKDQVARKFWGQPYFALAGTPQSANFTMKEY